jgi:hypothetical protein
MEQFLEKNKQIVNDTFYNATTISSCVLLTHSFFLLVTT